MTLLIHLSKTTLPSLSQVLPTLHIIEKTTHGVSRSAASRKGHTWASAQLTPRPLTHQFEELLCRRRFVVPARQRSQPEVHESQEGLQDGGLDGGEDLAHVVPEDLQAGEEVRVEEDLEFLRERHG